MLRASTPPLRAKQTALHGSRTRSGRHVRRPALPGGATCATVRARVEHWPRGREGRGRECRSGPAEHGWRTRARFPRRGHVRAGSVAVLHLRERATSVRCGIGCRVACHSQRVRRRAACAWGPSSGEAGRSHRRRRDLRWRVPRARSGSAAWTRCRGAAGRR